MYVDLGELEIDNPLRTHIVFNAAGLVFPAGTLGAFSMGILIRWSGGYSLGATDLERIGLLAVLLAGGIAALFGALDWWHTPSRVTVSGASLRYSGLRWSLIFPKRLDLEMERGSFRRVGRPRWRGAATLAGVARIRNDPVLEGRPYRDFVILSPVILARLGVLPGERFGAVPT